MLEELEEPAKIIRPMDSTRWKSQESFIFVAVRTKIGIICNIALILARAITFKPLSIDHIAVDHLNINVGTDGFSFKCRVSLHVAPFTTATG